MSIFQLFNNLKNYTILRGSSSFSEDSNLDFLASLDFGMPEKRKCSKGYPCGKSCIQTTKNCKNPIEGQAKIYSEWLELENKKNKPDTIEPIKIVEPEPIPEIIVNLADFESVKNLGERLAKKYLESSDGIDYEAEAAKAKEEIQKLDPILDNISESLYAMNQEGIFEGDDYNELWNQQNDLLDKYQELNIRVNAANEKIPFENYRKILEAKDSLESAKRNLESLRTNAFMYKHLMGEERIKEEQKIIKDIIDREKEYIEINRKLGKSSGYSEIYQELVSASGKSEADANVWLNSLGKRTAKVKKSDQAFKDVYRLTGGNIPTLKKLGYTTKRAYANESDGFINVGASERPAIIFHEVGHHLEYSNPALKESANAFLEKRSSGKIQTLRKITGSKAYKADEVAVIDNFVDPYVGKKYENGSTEVISMGLERFSTPEEMQKFRDKDPEHFHYILGVLAYVNNLKP